MTAPLLTVGRLQTFLHIEQEANRALRIVNAELLAAAVRVLQEADAVHEAARRSMAINREMIEALRAVIAGAGGGGR